MLTAMWEENEAECCLRGVYKGPPGETHTAYLTGVSGIVTELKLYTIGFDPNVETWRWVVEYRLTATASITATGYARTRTYAKSAVEHIIGKLYGTFEEGTT